MEVTNKSHSSAYIPETNESDSPTIKKIGSSESIQQVERSSLARDSISASSDGRTTPESVSSGRTSSSIQRPSFLLSTGGRFSFINWGEKGRIAVEGKREELKKQGSLLSVSDFQAIAGRSVAYSLGVGKSDRRELLGLLKEYEDDRSTLTNDQKLQRLQTLLEHAKDFILKQGDKAHQKTKSDDEMVQIKNIWQAAVLLREGILKEMESFSYSTKNEISAKEGPGGAMAQTLEITYKIDNQEINGFFKSVGSEAMHSEAAKEAGIPSASTLEANLNGRAVVTYAVSKIFGFDENNLVPETHFAIHQRKIGSFQKRAEGEHLFKTESRPMQLNEEAQDFLAETACGNQDAGYTIDDIALTDPSLTKKENQIHENRVPITKERALVLVKQGKISKMEDVVIAVHDIDLSKPCYQYRLNCAHWLDLLCGQLDRHANNFIFGQKDIGLIDNDLSFPSEWKDFESIRSPMPFSLPRLIDSGTAEIFESLTPSILREQLQGYGLSQNEIEAAVSRLNLLKIHVEKIKDGNIPDGKVVDDWNKETYDISMKYKDNYLKRCVEDLKQAKSRIAST